MKKKSAITILAAMVICMSCGRKQNPPAPVSVASGTFVVDASVITGPVNKGLLGVNHGPVMRLDYDNRFDAGNTIDLSTYYREAGINSARLDEFGFIDIQQLFPDFSADHKDPDNYTFELADKYLKPIVDLGIEVYFRLGYSEQKPRTAPPSDFEKWADVMVQVIRHYNDGWANGHQWGIKHWEIWNEPSGHGWTGTIQQYCELYDITAKKIKAYNPSLLVGGPALGGPDLDYDHQFAQTFIKYCQEKKSPLDFFSWHLYFNNPKEYIDHGMRHRNFLNQHGFSQTKLHLTEWGWLSGNGYPPPKQDLAGISDAAADISAMIVMHDFIDIAHFYLGVAMLDYPWGLFDLTSHAGKPVAVPRKSYYAMKAFYEFSEMENKLKGSSEKDYKNNFTGIAGINKSKDKIRVLLSNYGSPINNYTIRIENMPWLESTSCKVYMIDSAHNSKLISTEAIKIKNNTLEISGIQVSTPSVCSIVLERS